MTPARNAPEERTTPLAEHERRIKSALVWLVRAFLVFCGVVVALGIYYLR